MSSYAQSFTRSAVQEMQHLAAPLLAVAHHPVTLYRFLHQTGWDLEPLFGVSGNRLLQEIALTQRMLNSVYQALQQEEHNAIVAEAHERFAAFIDRLEQLYPVLMNIPADQSLDHLQLEHATAFAKDLSEHLLLSYLFKRIPLAFQLGRLFGFITQQPCTPLYPGNDPGEKPLRYPIVRPGLNWNVFNSPRTNPFAALFQQIDFSAIRSLESLLAEIQKLFQQVYEEIRRKVGQRGLDGMMIHLDLTGLRLVGGGWLPFPDAAEPPLHIQLPQAGTPQLQISSETWHFSWLPGLAAPDGSMVIFQQSWVAITLLPAVPDKDNASQPGIYCYEDEQNGLSFEIVGGLGIRFPLDMLMEESGNAVAGSARGRLLVNTQSPAQLTIDEIKVSGNFRLGGQPGLRIVDAQLTIANIVLPQAEPGAFPFQVTMSGQLLLPDGQSHIEAWLRFDEQQLEFRSTAQVHLGNGIWLHPLDDQPVLQASVHYGEDYSFAVNALFLLPHEDGGSKAIEVAGSLLLTQNDGVVQLTSFEAVSQGTHLDWALPGGLSLKNAGAALRYENGQFEARLSGELQIDTISSVLLELSLAFPDLQHPEHMLIDAVLGVQQLNFFDQLYIFEGHLHLFVDTNPISGFIELIDGAGGLMAKNPLTAFPGLSDFHLAVEELTALFEFNAQGFELKMQEGRLLLPSVFHHGGTERASASIGPQPLVLILANGVFSFELEIVVENIGADFSSHGEQGFVALLEQAQLRMSSTEPVPQLIEARGQVVIPLFEGDPLELDFEQVAWDISGFPRGAIFLSDDLVFPLGGGFELIFLGGTADNISTGLTVINPPAGLPEFIIDGALELKIPLDMLTEADGDQLFMGSSGQLRWQAGQLPQPTLGELWIGGSFLLGGNGGVRILEGALRAEGIPNILDPSPDHPFRLLLSGKIYLGAGGPGGGIEDASFSFIGEALPEFDFQGFYLDPGEDTLSAIEQLPLKVRELEVHFIAPLPLPEKLQPTNIEVTLSAELELPMPSGGDLIGRVDDIVIRFNSLGVPVKRDGSPGIDIGGIGMGIDNFQAGSIVLTGVVYLGGLDQPDDLFFAGKVGGKMSGTGVTALLALGTDGPRGVCLEVSGGSTGITLAYGFMLVGAEGGVVFPNPDGRVSNADPCDIRTYITLDDDGKPQRHDLPPAPRQEVPEDEKVIQEAASGEVALSPEFDCPQGPCPPPAISIVSQPHPDRRRHPDRVILKFTSIEEAALNELGITPAFFASLGLTTPDEMASAVLQPFIEVIDASMPDLSGLTLPPGVAFDIDQTLQQMKSNAQNLLKREMARGIEMALQGNSSVYEAVRMAAYAGIPSPEITVKLTGTLSYTGVSTFLSITGGFSISTVMIPQPVPLISTVGILGSINLLGIPIGTARLFMNLTDSSGTPLLMPTICGEIYAGIGPIEFGQLKMKFQAEGLTEGLAGAGATFVQHLSAPLMDEVLRRVDPQLTAAPDYDPAHPAPAVAQLQLHQITAFAGTLMNLPPDRITPDIKTCFRQLITQAWASFQPTFTLCGAVQPKIFGFGLGAELVNARINITKTSFAAQFGFSPSFIISYYTGGILPPSDQASVGMAFELPDPVALIDRLLMADLNSAAELSAYLEEGFTHVLSTANYTIEYEIAPFGLKMADAEARFLMPDLIHHPSYPGSNWKRPEARSNRNYLPRLELLLAALTADVWANPLWKGSATDLSQLTGNATRGLSLMDYFPHGGFAGAGKLALPKILLDGLPPSLISELFSESTTLFQRFNALKTIIDEHILLTEDIGQLAFYMPFPNPPVFTIDGRPPSPQEIVRKMQQETFDFSGLGINSPLPTEESFFQGKIENARLLGVPIMDASVDIQGADLQSGAMGRMEIDARVPQNSWLSQFVTQASLKFSLNQSPPQAIADYFTTLRSASPAADLLERFAAGLPKMALEASIDPLRMPAPLSDILKIEAQTSATLTAYSPAYDLEADDSDPLKRTGGISFSFSFRLLIPGLLDVAIPQATLQLLPASLRHVLPKVIGSFTVNSLSMPLGWPALLNSLIRFNSAPARGEALLHISGQITHIPIGRFSWVPLRGSRISSSLLVNKGRRGYGFDFSFDAARLASGAFLRSDITLSGPGRGQPVVLRSAGNWNATLSGKNIRLIVGATEMLRLVSSRPLSGRLSGNGLEEAQIDLTLPVNISLTAFPQHPAFSRKLSALRAGRWTLSISSKGSFALEASMPGLVFTLIRLSGKNKGPLQVRVSDSGLKLKTAAYLEIVGLTTKPFVLQQLDIGTNGHLRVQGQGGKISQTGFFDLTGGSVSLLHSPAATSVHWTSPRFYLFPGTRYQQQMKIGSFSISSRGDFSIKTGVQTFALPGLLTARGKFSFARSRNAFAGQLHNASLKIEPMKMNFQASLQFTPGQVRAMLGTKNFLVGGLIKVSSSNWRLVWEQGNALELSANSPGLWILNTSVLPQGHFQFSAKNDGSFSASGQTRSSLHLMSGLLEIGAGALQLSKSKTGVYALSLQGRVKALKHPVSGNWIVNTVTTLALSNGNFKKEITALRNKTFFDVGLARLYSNNSSRSYFRRQGSAYSFEFSGLKLKVMGQERSVNGSCSSSGALALSWSSSKTLNLGPFQLPGRKAEVSAHLKNQSLNVRIPAGKLKGPAITGFPGAGVDIAAVNFGASGDFTLNLSSFNFNGISINTSGSSNYIKLYGQSKTMKLRTSKSLWGATASLKLDISASGSVSGSLTGSFKLANVSKGNAKFASITLGSVTLNYNGSAAKYQFTKTITLNSVSGQKKKTWTSWVGGLLKTFTDWVGATFKIKVTLKYGSGGSAYSVQVL